MPFFIADEKTMHSHFVLKSFSRLLSIVNLGYFALAGYNYIFSKLVSPELLYLGTAGMTCMNLFYKFYLRRLQATWVRRIEWDVDSEHLVIVKPSGISGESQRLLLPSDMAMDMRSKVRDCIYFDRSTGEGFATVNRGQWYNLMLFMHLMQRNARKKKE